MEERTSARDDMTSLQRRMAEHIIAQDNWYRKNDVRSILAETKVGAWRRRDILEKMRVIFTAG